VQWFFGNNLAQKFFNFRVYIVRVAVDNTAEELVEFGDKSCRVCCLIMFENFGEELIVCFAVCNVVSAA